MNTTGIQSHGITFAAASPIAAATANTTSPTVAATSTHATATSPAAVAAKTPAVTASKSPVATVAESSTPIEVEMMITKMLEMIWISTMKDKKTPSSHTDWLQTQTSGVSLPYHHPTAKSVRKLVQERLLETVELLPYFFVPYLIDTTCQFLKRSYNL